MGIPFKPQYIQTASGANSGGFCTNTVSGLASRRIDQDLNACITYLIGASQGRFNAR
jgi:hypothetical protein